jgi:chromate transport protein ChrA
MSHNRRSALPAWTAFALPAAIAVLIVAAILLDGPVAGFLAAGVIAACILIVAVRGDLRLASDRRRSAVARRSLVPLVLACAGILLAALSSGTARIIGWGVIGVAIVVALSLVFLEVGYSEDRARAEEARRRRQARPSGG